MKSARGPLWVIISLLLMGAPPASARNTLDSVKATLIRQWDALRSLSGKFNGGAEVKLNPDMPSPIKLLAGGFIDYLKDGNTAKYRFNAWAGFSETALIASVNSLCDGTQVHVDTLAPFGKRAGNVSPAEEAFALGGKSFFDRIERDMNLTLLPDETVDGKGCFVLEAVAKKPDPSFPIAKSRGFFAKDIGVLVKVAFLDATNKELGAVTMTDLKVNQPIAEDAFNYAPPVQPAPPAVPSAAPVPNLAPAPGGN